MARKKRAPWERMPKESDPAWEAFRLYRDWPAEHGTKRTLEKVSIELGKSMTLMTRWSFTYDWRSRCSEYDNYLDEEAIGARVRERIKREHERAEMQDRHVQISIQLQRTFLDALKKIDPEEASPKQLSEIANAFQKALEIETASREATNADRRLDLQREMFEYQKEQDAGENIEYEYMDDVEADIYGDGDGGRESDSSEAKDS